MKEPFYKALAELQTKPLPPEFETVSGPLPHNLLNDLMFRIVFESDQNGLKSLLCSLLHYKPEEIVAIEIKTPIQLGKSVDDKTYIFDINLLLNNHKQVHLELQVLGQTYWTERSLCYLCRSFGKINAGENYSEVKPLIQIDILDFALYENSKEFYSTYHLTNDKTGRIYSDKIALHVLELNKDEYATEEDKAYNIDYWARLFKATTWEELKMLAKEQENLQSTIETIYRANADEYVRAELEAREDELRRQRTVDNELKRQLELLAAQRQQLNDQASTIDNLLAENAKLKALLEQNS